MAAFDFREDERASVLALRGDWTVDTIAGLERGLAEVSEKLKAGAVVDVSSLGRFDVAGAYLIDRTFRESAAGDKVRIAIRGEHTNAMRLLQAARKSYAGPAPPPRHFQGLKGFFDLTGRAMVSIADEIVETVGFFGETLVTIGKQIVNPRLVRPVSIVNVMEKAGLNALPIVMLLSFFIGMVVAYLGARILADFGATVFVVELVAISMLREFGVVITAVILAGRTNSSFTAEIGAMKMRQEIDAMRVIGISPMDALVVPRVIAMLLMTPILTFAAMMAGMFGGVLVCWGALDISPAMFLGRFQEVVPAQHFWVGFVKAPAFALVLAVIACKQGLSVGGDVGSLGSRVTTSVVQGIFMVILMDAIFALWFLEMDW
ncbi:MAG: MlaE family lipid ABC transporter permease subunit [Hyphomonadaceae bacterium]|jgi:phospholipid/cholesterol/gamma-HCH transport system permease protein|nr:MlaE family lipid ABC transporter permease subunit [Hyphomonadaceae bacterium]